MPLEPDPNTPMLLTGDLRISASPMSTLETPQLYDKDILDQLLQLTLLSNSNVTTPSDPGVSSNQNDVEMDVTIWY